MIIYSSPFENLETELSEILNKKRYSEEMLLKKITEIGSDKSVNSDLVDVFELYQFVKIKKAYETNAHVQVAIETELQELECDNLSQFYALVQKAATNCRSEKPVVKTKAQESLVRFQQKIKNWYDMHIVAPAEIPAQLKIKRDQLEDELKAQGFEDYDDFQTAFEFKKKEYDRLKRKNLLEKATLVQSELDAFESIEKIYKEIEQLDKTRMSQGNHDAAAESVFSKTSETFASVNPIRNNYSSKLQVDLSSAETPPDLIDSAYSNLNRKESTQVAAAIHQVARKTAVAKSNDIFDDAAVKFSYFNGINMPNCAEKSVFLLFLYLRRELEYNKEGYSPLFDQENAIAICRSLEEQLIDERLCTKKEAQQTTEELLSVLRLPHLDKFSDKRAQLECRKKLEAIKITLDTLLKEIRPVDISWLLNLLEQARLAANQISGKDIGLFLGETGVGKSTTMHFLSGAQMTKVKIDGLSHIAPLTSPNNALKDITTSPHSFSVTKSIHPVDIKIPASISHDSSTQITLCDCPGFEDSKGVESDIANSVIITTSIRKAATIKPIVFISSRSVGERFKGILSLVKTLVKFMPRAEDHFSSFTYVFTKYEKNKAVEIIDQINSVITYLDEEQANTSFSRMIENMRDQVTDNIIVLDPLNDDPVTLLKELMSKQAIKITDNTFADYTSASSYHAVREQLVKHSQAIESALLRRKIDLAIFKLNELSRLHDLFHLEDVRRIYLSSLDYLQKWLIQLWNTVEQSFSQYIHSDSSESEDSLRCLAEKIFLLVEAEQIRAMFIKEKDMSNLLDRCKSKIEATIQSLVISTQNVEEDHGELSANKHTKNLKNSFFVLQKIEGLLNIISSVYPSDTEFFDEALKNKADITRRLESEHKSLYESAVEVYINRTVDKTRELARLLEKLRIFDEQGSKFIKIDSDKNYISIKNDLNRNLILSLDRAVDSFKYFYESTADNMEREPLSVENISIAILDESDKDIGFESLNELEKLEVDFIQRTVFFVRKLFQEEQLQEHLGLENLQAHMNNLYLGITSTIEFVNKKLFPSLLGFSFFDDFDRVKIILEKIKIIEALTDKKEDSSFYSIKLQLREYIQALKREVLHDIASMQTGRNHGIEVNINYELFGNRISSLYKAEKHRDALESWDIWSDEFNEVVSSLNEFIETTAKILAKVEIPRDYFYDFPIKFIYMRNCLANLFALEINFIKREGQIQGVIEPFDIYFDDMLHQMSEKIAQNEFYGKDLLEFLDFLGVFSFIDNDDVRKNLLQLSETINDKIVVLKERLQDSLATDFRMIWNLDSTEELLENKLRNAARSIVVQLKTLHELSIALEQRVDGKKLLNPISKDLINFYNQFFASIDELKHSWVDKPVDQEDINLFVYLEELNNYAAIMHEKNELLPGIWFKIIIAHELQDLHYIFPEQLQYQTALVNLENVFRAVEESKLNDLKIYAENLNFENFFEIYDSFDALLLRKAESILVSLLGKVTDKAEHLRREIEEFRLDHVPLNEKDFESLLLQFTRILGVKELQNLMDSDQHPSLIACRKTEESIKNKFSELDEILIKALEDHSLFYAYCLLQFSKVIKKFCNEKQLSDLYNDSEYIQSLDKEFEQLIEKNVAQCKILDVEEYPKALPKIFLEQLKQLADANKDYADIYLNVAEKIQQKVRQIILDCQKDMPSFDVRQKLKDLKDLEIYLTPDIPQGYAKELLALESQIKDREEKSRQELDQLNKAKNLVELVKNLQSKKYLPEQYEWSCVIHNCINDNFKDLTAMLESGQAVEMADVLISSWNSWSIFQHQVEIILGAISRESSIFFSRNYYDSNYYKSAFTKYLGSIQDVRLKMIQYLSDKLMASYDFLSSSLGREMVTSDFLSNIKEHLHILAEVIKIWMNYQSNSSNITYYLYDSLCKLDEYHKVDHLGKLIRQQVSFLEAQTKSFKENLSSGDFDKVKQILESFSKHPELNDKIFSLTETLNKYPEQALIVFDKKECFSYENMQNYLQVEFDELLSIAGRAILHDVQAKSTNPDERFSKHEGIANAYFSLISFKKLLSFFSNTNLDVNKKVDSIGETIKNNLKALEAECLSLIQRIPNANRDRSYDDLNIWHENLLLAKKVFEKNSLSQEIEGMLKRVEAALVDRLERKAQEVVKCTEDREVVSNLLQLKDLTLYFTFFRNKIEDYINKILREIAEIDPKRIEKFLLLLNRCEEKDKQIARLMIDEHKVFEVARREAHNAETQGMDYKKVLFSLEEYNKNNNSNSNSDLDVKKLEIAFEKFNKSYTELVNENRSQILIALPEIISSAKRIASSPGNYSDINVQLVANLFAYWTLKNAPEIAISLEKKNNDRNKIAASLLQPHAAQVISIFRFLGIDVASSKHLANHMIQIGTGEGKSVTLAITACVLALNGYDVDCACYSEYLSERDYQDFEDIFNAFGLKENIKYGTFNQLSEHFINQNGDVREMVECFIKEGTVSSVKKSTSGRRRIFLIDEVDVFFSKDFYGKNYCVFSQINDPSISALIKYIWSIRANNRALRLDEIKSTKEFADCCNSFQDWQPLIEEAVKAMIIDVKVFHGHRGVKYDIENDKITYPTQYHKNSDSLTYRYQTAFAYIFECENKKISSSSRDAHLSLIIDSGSFSFAEVPKKYEYIMGVTGTLETLNSSEKKLLTEEYFFNKFSYMPSTYGKNELKFAGDNLSDVLIEDNPTFYQNLTREIARRQVGLNTRKEKRRPVMVFFSTKEKLDEFYNSNEFSYCRDRANKLTEDLRDDVKAGYILKAVQQGVITLMTRGFGRGTDFKCYDEAITIDGGIHVIQTFVSEAIAEETQIKGRGARQGKSGSYSMVLNSDDLLNFYSIGPSAIEEMKSSGKVYTSINNIRNSRFQTMYEESLRQVVQIKIEHAETEKFIEVILNGNNKGEAKNFLLKRNEISMNLLNSTKCARTICLMDATGSMSALLTKAKNTVEQMFIRAYQILNDKKCYEAFELQFVFYRNYSSKDQILLCSGWESSPGNMKQYLETIKPEGGQGNEAIEIGLSYVNNEIGATNENNITQVILIGDRAPNTPEEVQKNRSNVGEKYWNNTRFSEPTNSEKELDKLRAFNQTAGDKKIPVHCFYLDNKGGFLAQTMAAFENIAQHTEGKSGLLDIDSPEGAELLTAIITERILFVLGGDDFVDAYHEKYGEIRSGHISSASSSFFSHTRQAVDSEVMVNSRW